MDTVLRFLMKYPLLAMDVSAEKKNRAPGIVFTEKVPYNSSSHEGYNDVELKKASGF
jgi:hypothetical protein